MSDFSVSCSTDGPADVVVVAGELDIYTAPEVQSAIDGCIEGGKAPVIADFSDVTFMDSTAIGMVIRADQRMTEFGRRFVVVSETPQVRRIFQLTGMYQFAPLYATMADARAEVE